MNLQSWRIRHGVSLEALRELEYMLNSPSDVSENSGQGSEGGVAQRTRLIAPDNSGVLWRNNVGQLLDARGIPIRYGLCNSSKKVNKEIKSSDLIGITRVEWYGRVFGVFTAIETKAPKWTYKGNERETAQLKYINIVRSFGGIGTFAASPEDYTQAITGYCNGL